MDTVQLPKVCIIGAGSSGITAAKVFHERGIPFDCYEKGSQIGGNWRYLNDNGMSSAYRSLHINTCRDQMCYSDFPMPADYPDFPHHSQIIRYFDDYVDHFGFRDKIIFRTGVAQVKRAVDGTYAVTTDRGQTSHYRAVVVANGHHWQPRYPEPPFTGNFAGPALHAHDYKTPDVLENKNVLVVGIGNSGVDIACEAARLNTGKVFISTRSSAYIMPKYILGKPFDRLNKLAVDGVPTWLKRSFLSLALWIAHGRQEAYGVPKPSTKLLQEHPTISQDLLNLVGHGRIRIKPNVSELAGNEVAFVDGTREPIDLIIYATGYKISFPFFKPDFFDTKEIEESNRIHLYHRVVHPDYENLFFVGLVQPLGAIMPIAEVQAKWIAGLLTGETALPDKETMRRSIQKDNQKVLRTYRPSPRHTIEVDFYPYKHLLEKEMKRKRIPARQKA